jgi:hypothetical protein
MDLESVNKVMAVIGENSRMATGKDMEYMIMIVETDTSGNTCRITDTGMEYTDTQMEQYIMDSTRMTRDKEKES